MLHNRTSIDEILYRRLVTMAALREATRIKLLGAFTSDPRVWKADDGFETVVIAVKTTVQDSDDYTFFTHKRGDTVLTLLGTTTLGKDAGVAPIVYNDGTIGLYTTEAATTGAPGNTAELYFVTLQDRLAAEPSTSGGIDTWMRSVFKSFMIGLRDLAIKFI